MRRRCLVMTSAYLLLLANSRDSEGQYSFNYYYYYYYYDDYYYYYYYD
jgi:hypothetical protein